MQQALTQRAAPCPIHPPSSQVKALIEKVYAIPDGMGNNRRPYKVRVVVRARVVCVVVRAGAVRQGAACAQHVPP